ncbi:MAG: IS1182 family transposase [Planctomycetota bacterium]|nr:IS1182 family transposase [Planctomycetota bacterium]
METASRDQVEMRLASVDELLPEDHRARMVWAMVEEYDLRAFYEGIKAVEGEAGRPAIDPKLLVAVWLYATLEGVGSARALARLCEHHLAYQWLLGGVSVNYHTLADFRVQCEAELDGILTRSVAALMSEGLVELERTAQDGVRIRASAGASSFRRKETLEASLGQAEARVQQLKAGCEGDGEEQGGQRQRAAKRKDRPARASSTDPEARVTKMADGGFRPAYNGQLNVDMHSRIIVGVELSNEADQRLLTPMLEQTEARYGRLMAEHYVDGGFRSNAGIEDLEKKGVAVYSPIPVRYNKNSKRKPEEILPSDSPEVVLWKERMVTEEAKQKYKGRAATVEWANALLRNRGLYRFLVRGIRKARTVLLWFALAHNLFQVFSLRQQSQLAVG